MTYKVYLHKKAAASLSKLNNPVQSRIKDSIKELELNPEKGEKLTGSNFWRLRVGDYRVIYEIDNANKKILVLYIGHRRNVYDDFSRLL